MNKVNDHKKKTKKKVEKVKKESREISSNHALLGEG
jgi:hypothetical protein